MATTYIKVRSLPDALVKVYKEQPEAVIYLDNTDDNGETAKIPLAVDGSEYFIDITPYPEA